MLFITNGFSSISSQLEIIGVGRVVKTCELEQKYAKKLILFYFFDSRKRIIEQNRPVYYYPSLS
jgi:hypothetical protein